VESLVALDVDLLELKVETVGAELQQALAGLVAKMAVRPPVQPD